MKLKYDQPDWAIFQKEDKGVVYDVCRHGYLHPNSKWLQMFNLKFGDGRDYSIHLCTCGCCSKTIREINDGKEKSVTIK